jgi:hypothetical protein
MNMPMRFKVLYKMPNTPRPVQVDHIMEDLPDLVKFLAKDGVTKDSVQYLYVHCTPHGSNDTMEMLAINNADKPSETVHRSNVIPINQVKHLAKAASTGVKAESKPKVKAQEVKDLGIVRHGLYSAMKGA